jgi:tRNA pseudouridine13 synthase
LPQNLVSWGYCTPAVQGVKPFRDLGPLTMGTPFDTMRPMRIKHIPEDFIVQEELALPLESAGPYAVYRVEKRGITTFQVQARLAARLGMRRSAIDLPALKDRQSVAVQYASIKGTPPTRIEGEGFSATLAGRLDRRLRPTDIGSNRFTVTVRDLSPDQAEMMSRRFDEMAADGLPNYFDEQRFGSYHPEKGWIGKRILDRDEERALHAYLAVAFPRDPGGVKQFKEIAAAHWGEWDFLFEAAPKPSNYRSVLTFLRDHPQDYRKALNLIPYQLLSLYLSSYQSFLWNRIVGTFLAELLDSHSPPIPWQAIRLCDVDLPVYRSLTPDVRARLAHKMVSMPHHRAVYREPALAAAVNHVLQAEGLALEDLKARILKKAYVDHHQRPVLLFPAAVSVAGPQTDDRFPNRRKLVASFVLPRGSYATLVLKCADLG